MRWWLTTALAQSSGRGSWGRVRCLSGTRHSLGRERPFILGASSNCPPCFNVWTEAIAEIIWSKQAQQKWLSPVWDLVALPAGDGSHGHPCAEREQRRYGTIRATALSPLDTKPLQCSPASGTVTTMENVVRRHEEGSRVTAEHLPRRWRGHHRQSAAGRWVWAARRPLPSSPASSGSRRLHPPPPRGGPTAGRSSPRE